MAHNSSEHAICIGPQLQIKPASFAVPKGSADCHAHVFGPRERYPYSDKRYYTPPPVFVKEYIEMHDALGIERGVLVQSAVHGINNDVILDTIAQYPDRLRGVGLIDESFSDAELDRMHEGGVRGFRVNTVAKIGVQMDAARKLASRVARLGWHIQFLLDVEQMPNLDTVFGEFPTEVVIDHMGRPDPKLGVEGPGFQALIRLLKSGRGWTKLSAPYRTSLQHPPYSDMNVFAQALIAAAPDRLVWGSDWPHVTLETPMPNDGDLLDMLAVWAPDPGTRARILVDNPVALYGFGS
ncbi:MAG: amidohydrolase family protein [Pseudolabrys sp.]|nr:amidohydrolase family protein [Pseudolabrys sp.]